MNNANKLITRCPWEPLLLQIFNSVGGVLDTPQSCTPTSPPRPPCVFTSTSDLKEMVVAYNTARFSKRRAAIVKCGLIGDWDVSAITDMSKLFKNTGPGGMSAGFDEPLTNWDTSKVTTMAEMFAFASAFNQPLSFKTSSVTDMAHMFAGASAFNQPLSFKTSSV